MLSPRGIQAKFQDAEELFLRNDFTGALRLLSNILSEESSAEHFLLYGICLAKLRRGKESKAGLLEAHKRDPDLFYAITWLAAVSIMVGELDEALAYAQKAVALKPDEWTSHSTLGDCYLSRRELALAESNFLKAAELNSEEPTIYHNLGQVYGLMGKSSDAIRSYVLAVELAPTVVSNYLALSRVHARHSMVGDAIDLLKEGLSAIPFDTQLLGELASTYALARNRVLAEKTYKELLDISPKSRLGYAGWLQEEGRFDDAAALYRQSIVDGINLGQSHYGLVHVSKAEALSISIPNLLDYAKVGDLPNRERMYTCYALGKIFNDRKQFEEANEAYNRANQQAFRIYQAGRGFEIESLRQLNDRVFEKFTNIQAASRNPGSPTPIFIVGMIRSGTTVLEQIISSHPKVAPTGELRFWIEEGPRLALKSEAVSPEDVTELRGKYLDFSGLLARKAPFFTDKMPLNFGLMGLIQAALPEAKFIHIRRHPIDICLSIWMTFFGGGPQFVYNRSNIVDYYREYERVSARWRQHMPVGSILEVDYEELVQSREDVMRSVLDFCGLEWNDSVLHHESNRGAVSTPSRWQARQPLYTSSIHRWKHYEPWLEEFAALLP